MRDDLKRERAFRARRGATMRSLDAAIFYALLAVVVLAAVPYGTVETWWEALFEISVFFLAALSLVVWRLEGERSLKLDAMFAPLAVLILFAVFQTLPLTGASGDAAARASGELRRAFSADPFQTRLTALKLLALTATLWLFLRHASSLERLRALVHTVLGVGVASALFGIFRQATQGDSPDFVLPYLEPSLGYAQFINQNHFAYLMETSLGLALGMIFGKGVRREQALSYVAAALPVWTALVLSKSRGGILSMLCQFLFVALLAGVARKRSDAPPDFDGFDKTKRRASSAKASKGRAGARYAVRFALIASLLFAVAFGVVWMGGDNVVTRLESVSSEISREGVEGRGGVSRIEIWRATWRMFEENPFAGAGFGAYSAAVARYHEASGELKPQQAHNDYLEILASGGVIGAALAAWFVVVLIRRTRRVFLRSSRDPFRRAVCLGAATGMFGVAVHSIVDFGLQITSIALFFVALVAAATVDGDLEGGDERHARRSL